MQLSSVQEDTNAPRKLYLGLENFQATAVNPTLAELQAMGIPATTEPEYVVKIERDFGDGVKEYDAVNIRVYLTNNDPTNLIKTQVNYQVIKASHLSSTNKYKVINKYGTSTWLEQGHITAGSVPANMAWYVNDGVKTCYRGEDTLISFIKSYRNLPNIKGTSDADARKKGITVIEDADWENMFKGNFKDIRSAIMDIKEGEGKVGFLMGVKHLEDKDVQTLYKASPLKRYIKKVGGNTYLTKDVNDSQQAGAYADVTFDTSNYKLREYDVNMDKVVADTPGLPSYSDIGENDDLPF